jgi:NDP-sugar pyrophosphorylase family protein
MQAVILAGGLATRLLPLSEQVPKSMIPVAGRPFIAWQLERLAASGLARVVLCIGHLGQQIRDYVGDGARFLVHVTYSEDGSTPLGTGGALRRALPWLEPRFVVTYGDSYLPFDYESLLLDLAGHPLAAGTLAVYENRGRWERSNVEVAGDRVVRYAKGVDDPRLDHIDYGAMALTKATLAALPEGTAFGLDQLQQELASRGRLRALRARERFYEIGSAAGLAELEAYLTSSARGSR